MIQISCGFVLKHWGFHSWLRISYFLQTGSPWEKSKRPPWRFDKTCEYSLPLGYACLFIDFYLVLLCNHVQRITIELSILRNRIDAANEKGQRAKYPSYQLFVNWSSIIVICFKKNYASCIKKSFLSLRSYIHRISAFIWWSILFSRSFWAIMPASVMCLYIYDFIFGNFEYLCVVGWC